MVAGAHIGIDAETLASHALAVLDHLPQNGRHAPASIQLALALRDDDLGSLVRRRQRLTQRVYALLHLVRLNRPHPLDAHAAHRALDRIPALSILYVRPRGWDVLTAGGRGVAVVHDDSDGIMLIEDGISNAAGQAVVPEAAVPHDRYRALAALAAAQGRPARGTQTVSHDAGAHVERRQSGERVTADIGAHMYAAQFLLYDFHRREKRPFGTTGAQARRPRRNRFSKLLDRQQGLLSWQRLLSRQGLRSRLRR